ncbi:MAG: hypothetical protein VYD78_07825 [Gemmatimonadota bacterium]|nr:hypothetical protein [Gemmatimonadota bacterium]
MARLVKREREKRTGLWRRVVDLVGLQQEFGLSVKLIGSGEDVGDFETFNPDDFIEEVLAE